MFVEETYTIPAEATTSLVAFRHWASSDDSPDRGRFDYINGEIDVEWEPEELDTHGALKGELLTAIANRVKDLKLGYVFTRARFSSPSADLSAQPDAMLIAYVAIESGHVRLVPKAGGEPGRYVEIEGPPDLIVEVVSDSTVHKDTTRLPRAYFEAGVKEFWLADGRKEELTFVVHRRGESGFEPVTADADGFQPSLVLGTSFRLDRSRDRLEAWRYNLISL